MAAVATYKCQSCKQDFTARTADRARGWARFCSKSCKATKQAKSRLGDRYHYYQRKYGGTPQFTEKGRYVGFTMSPEELAGEDDGQLGEGSFGENL